MRNIMASLKILWLHKKYCGFMTNISLGGCNITDYDGQKMQFCTWLISTQTIVDIPSFSSCNCVNPLPDDKMLDRSKLKQSADDNFEFDVNSRKLSKLVQNTVDKGEIARDEQFLLFPQCSQKACFPRVSKGVIVWEWVKHLLCISKRPTRYTTQVYCTVPIIYVTRIQQNVGSTSNIRVMHLI